MATNVSVRPLAQSDDIIAITELLHAAYAQREATNLRYWGTHQTPDETVHRFARGQGFLAEIDGEIVGTITVRPPDEKSPVALYRQPTTWTLAQFGVSPMLQGTGVGRQLHNAAVAHAATLGAKTIALDTAAPALELIEMYRRWGYAIVGEADWRPHTNYLSIVMSKAIEAHAL